MAQELLHRALVQRLPDLEIASFMRRQEAASISGPVNRCGFFAGALSNSSSSRKRPQTLSRKARASSGAVVSSSNATAADDAPSQPTSRPSAAELARTVMEMAVDGALSTRHAEDPELSLGTHVEFVLDAAGRPILLIPSRSIASRNLLAHSRCSLYVQVELPGLQKPQVIICGHASVPSDHDAAQRAEMAWKRRYGDSWAAIAQAETPQGDEGTAPLWVLSVEAVLAVRDVGVEEEWIDAEEYFDADADPLRDHARGIVEDVNREHWQDLPRLALCFAGFQDEVEDASLIWVDRLGLDLRVWTGQSAAGVPGAVRDVRIPFSREASDEREARSAITMMAQVAWEKERNYSPTLPSLMSSHPQPTPSEA